MEKRLVLPYEVARALGVSVSWVRTHAAPSAKNRMPVQKVGNLLRFDLDQVFEWIRNANETPRQG